MKSYLALAMMMAACASTEGRSAFMDRLPLEEPKRKPIGGLFQSYERRKMEDSCFTCEWRPYCRMQCSCVALCNDFQRYMPNKE